MKRIILFFFTVGISILNAGGFDSSKLFFGLGIGNTQTTTSAEGYVEARGKTLNIPKESVEENGGSQEFYIGYQLIENIDIGLTYGHINTDENNQYEVGYYLLFADYNFPVSEKLYLFGGAGIGQGFMDFSYNESGISINIDTRDIALGLRTGFGYKVNDSFAWGFKYQYISIKLEGEDDITGQVNGYDYKLNMKASHEDFSTITIFFNVYL